MATRPRTLKKVRVGFRPGDTSQGEAIGQGTFRQKTPIQRVRKELTDALEPYNITDTLKKEIISEALLIDTITTMSMLTFAAVVMYLRDHPQPDPEDFTDETLDPYLDRLMQDFVSPKTVQGRPAPQKPSEREQTEVRYRYKQTMLRYILKILAFRAGTQLATKPLTTLGQPLEEEIVVGPRGEVEEEEEF